MHNPGHFQYTVVSMGMQSMVASRQVSFCRTTLQDYEDLNVLRNPRTASGYECVYRHSRQWRAVVMKRIRIGMFVSPVDAGRAVIAWYKQTYGELWREAFAMRRCNPWAVVRCKEGFAAWVWLGGVKMRLTLADVKKRPAKGDRKYYVWSTAAEARRAIRQWVYLRVGLFAPLLMYRVGRGSVKSVPGSRQ